jgi:hypothetical protein
MGAAVAYIATSTREERCMRTPDIHMTNETLLGLGTYTIAKVKAYEDTKELAPPLKATMDTLSAAGDARTVAELLVMTRMAIRDTADVEADALLGRLFHDVKGREGGTRPGPRGQLYFPKGLVAITGCSIPDQPGMMHTLAGRLEADADPTLAGQADGIHAKADDLADKVAALSDATDQAAVAHGEILRARAGFIRAYEKVYAQLIDHLGKRRAICRRPRGAPSADVRTGPPSTAASSARRPPARGPRAGRAGAQRLSRRWQTRLMAPSTAWRSRKRYRVSRWAVLMRALLISWEDSASVSEMRRTALEG